jgi:predicted aldo/keto reductase-like oxidoreductase
MYCGFESENAIRRALVERHPRESYTLADKLHAGFLECAEDRDRIFEEQRRKTGVEYFDYYLIHDINPHHYEIYLKYDCFGWAREKKAQGLIRQLGFSFHGDAELLERVLTDQPDMDFVQLQLNYLDWESEGVQSRKCYEVARRHGVDIVVMEPVKGGTLANVPPAVQGLFKSHDQTLSVPSWAIRFVAGLEGVKMVLSGMSNMEQLEDNVSVIDNLKPLTEDDMSIYTQARQVIIEEKLVPCTACEYCVPVCPQNIAIPKLFSLYNANRRIDAKDRGAFAEIPSECIECGACKEVCPQKLDIPEHIKHINRFYS